MIKEYSAFEKNAANHVPLSPLTFIEKTAALFPDRLAVVHGDRHYTWAESFARCRRLSSALNAIGINKGDTVAVMAFNTRKWSNVITVLRHRAGC